MARGSLPAQHSLAFSKAILVGGDQNLKAGPLDVIQQFAVSKPALLQVKGCNDFMGSQILA